MKIKIKNIKESPSSLLQSAGYIFQRHAGKEMSFIRPLAQAGYPRFHIYAYIENFNLLINIHLDQKKETYGDTTRHHGEYEDTGALKKEVQRILSIV